MVYLRLIYLRWSPIDYSYVLVALRMQTEYFM